MDSSASSPSARPPGRRLIWPWLAALALVVVLVLIGALLGPFQAAPPAVFKFSGSAMGGDYHVVIADPPVALSQKQCEQIVASELQRIDALFSTWRADSEVSKFNASPRTQWFAISPDTARAIQMAIDVGHQSGGGYDITVGPLVDLWGFGPDRRTNAPPDPADIARTRRLVGLDQLEVRRDPPAVRKQLPGLRIDLSSIGQGYAVDRAAEALEARGVRRYCIEFTGEIRARGLNAQGRPWTVGIETPQADIHDVQQVTTLQDDALATSGDYRNYVEVEGARYSHIIDPRTGSPVTHRLASVTVWDPCCARADAWSTALMVAGPEAARRIAANERLRVLLITRGAQGFEVERIEQK